MRHVMYTSFNQAVWHGIGVKPYEVQHDKDILQKSPRETWTSSHRNKFIWMCELKS